MLLKASSLSLGQHGARNRTARCKAVAPRPVLRLNHRDSAISPNHSARLVLAHATTSESKPSTKPNSAKEAVEAGLVAFNENKNYRTAVGLFKDAMDLSPTDDEAMAALYNLGCAHAKLKEWGPAAAAIASAVNDYRLKIDVAIKDPDLRELRERREWVDTMTKVKGGLSEESKVALRAEAKSPFRLVRFILFGAFGVGGSVGFFFSLSTLIGALNSGVEISEQGVNLQNIGVNAAVVAVTAFLVQRDLKTRERQLSVGKREEGLSNLQLQVAGNRQLPVGRFRGQIRPVIIAGTQKYVDRALREARPFQEGLRLRGVSVIPIVLDGKDEIKQSVDDPEDRIKALKKEFANEKSLAKGFGSPAAPSAVAVADGEAAAVKDSAKDLSEDDKKWQLQPYNLPEWKAWIRLQREAVNVPVDLKDCFIQVQLDGTVRSSGVSTPPWAQLMDDLPTLDSIRTTLTDGIGPNME
eukprot:gene27722-7368_t